MTEQKPEVLIIGAGPAGWSAAIFLARANLTPLVIGRCSDSGLWDAAEVWNFPGLEEPIPGRVLLERMQGQALRQGARFIEGEITHLEKSGDEFLVTTTTREEFRVPKIILAHGANYIKVDLPGEVRLAGKGVHYCALCDGALYKGKDIVVLGNRDLAAEEALQLTELAKTVNIVAHNQTTGFSNEYEKALKEKNIPVILGRVKELQGENKVKQIILEDGTVVDSDAVFIALGVASSFTFAQKLGLELESGFVKADPKTMRTNVPGIWAAGLARGGVNQIVKSVGEAGIAAVDIIKSITGLPQYIDHA